MSDPVSTADDFHRELNRRRQEYELRTVANRFSHHPPTSDQVVAAHEEVRRLGLHFGSWLVLNVPHSPEREKALDALDLAVMHTNAAVARHQLKTPEQYP